MRRVLDPQTITGLSGYALVALVAPVVLGAPRMQPDPASALRTPGAVVAVTYGRQPLVLVADRQKPLRPFAPNIAAHRRDTVLKPGEIGARSFLIWQNIGENVAVTRSMTGPTLYVDVSGDDGHRMSAALGYRGIHRVGRTTLATFEVRAYPRRSDRIRFRFPMPWYNGVVPPDIVVSNPAPGPCPMWKSAPLPIVRHSGGLEVALRSFKSDPAAAALGPACRLDLRLRKDGRPAAASYVVDGAAISDATGNSWTDSPARHRQSYGPALLDDQTQRLSLFASPLPEEPACRVRLELARASHYPRKDLWILRDLPIPGLRRTIKLNRRIILHGCAVELTELVGPMAYEDEVWSSGEPRAAVRISGPMNGLRLRDLTHAGTPWANDEVYQVKGGGPYLLSLTRLTRGRAALKLALTPRHTVEFLAHASRPSR